MRMHRAVKLRHRAERRLLCENWRVHLWRRHRVDRIDRVQIRRLLTELLFDALLSQDRPLFVQLKLVVAVVLAAGQELELWIALVLFLCDPLEIDAVSSDELRQLIDDVLKLWIWMWIRIVCV